MIFTFTDLNPPFEYPTLKVYGVWSHHTDNVIRTIIDAMHATELKIKTISDVNGDITITLENTSHSSLVDFRNRITSFKNAYEMAWWNFP